MQINTKILVGIIALLALLNLTIVGTILYKKNTISHQVKQKQVSKSDIIVPNNHLGRFFKKELNLSYQQHRKFQKIRQEYHQNTGIVIKKMDAVRTNIITELGKEKSDTIILNLLSKKLGNLHTQLKNLSIHYYLDMKAVCNPNQKTKLYKIFKPIVNSKRNAIMPNGRFCKKN